MLAIQILKEFQVRRVVIHGDSKLVIKQMQGEYQARHPKMRSYKNFNQDLIECFKECNFNLIPILKNCIDDSLATSTVVFEVPIHPSGKYEVKVRRKPSSPDNVKSWQVFEDNKHIQNFLTLTGEFYSLNIDENSALPEGTALT